MIWSASAFTMAWVLATAGQSPQQPKKLELIPYLPAGYAGLKADLTSAAETMPETEYGFQPTSMPEVGTFGAPSLHVPAAHCSMCARLRGVFFQAEDGIRDATVTGVQTCD